jgi:hypothetical protein
MIDDECPVYELEEKNLDFIMLRDRQVKHSLEDVEDDPNFIFFKIDHHGVDMISKGQLIKYCKSLENETVDKMMNEIAHKNAKALKKLAK